MRRDDPSGLTPVLPVLAIEAGARYLPATRVHLRDWARRRGPAIQRLLPSMMQNGLAHFHIAPGMDIEALSCAGVQRLLDGSTLRPRDIDMVVFCHTNTSSVMAAPASVPALLARRFGMDRALCWSVSQQSCASVMCALRLLPRARVLR